MFIFSGEPIPAEKARGCLIPLVLIGGWFVWHAILPPDFSDEDIRSVEASIREEFGKQSSVKVREVSLSRKERGKIIGIAKINIDILGTSQDFSKFCTASKTDKGSIWRCQ